MKLMLKQQIGEPDVCPTCKQEWMLRDRSVEALDFKTNPAYETCPTCFQSVIGWNEMFRSRSYRKRWREAVKLLQ